MRKRTIQERTSLEKSECETGRPRRSPLTPDKALMVMALAAVLLPAGPTQAADIDPGSFVFDTANTGLMEVSLQTLESNLCPKSSLEIRARSSADGLTRPYGPAEGNELKVGMNIQGMASANPSGPVAAAAIQLRVAFPVDLSSGTEQTTGVTITRFCMETTTPVTLSCDTFDAEVLLDPTITQSVGDLHITPNSTTTGGTFRTEVDLDVLLRFTSRTKAFSSAVSIPYTITYNGAGPWAASPGTGGATAPSGYLLDTDCDDVADERAPGTPDFYPGWTAGGTLTEVTFTDREKGGYLLLKAPLDAAN